MRKDRETYGRLAPVMTLERAASALMTSERVVQGLVDSGRLKSETCDHCGGRIVRAEAMRRMFGRVDGPRRPMLRSVARRHGRFSMDAG